MDICWAWDSTILLWCQKNSSLNNFLKVLFYETYLILPCLQSLKRQVAPRQVKSFCWKNEFFHRICHKRRRGYNLLDFARESRNSVVDLHFSLETVVTQASGAGRAHRYKHDNHVSENCKYKYKYEFDFAIRKLWFELHQIIFILVESKIFGNNPESLATYRQVNFTALNNLRFNWVCLIEKYVIISDCQSVEISFGTRTMFMDM